MTSKQLLQLIKQEIKTEISQQYPDHRIVPYGVDNTTGHLQGKPTHTTTLQVTSNFTTTISLYSLIIISLNETTLTITLRNFHPRIHFLLNLTTDLADPNSIQQTIDYILEQLTNFPSPLNP